MIPRQHDFAKIILADLTEYLEYLHLWLYFNKLTDKLKVWNFIFPLIEISISTRRKTEERRFICHNSTIFIVVFDFMRMSRIWFWELSKQHLLDKLLWLTKRDAPSPTRSPCHAKGSVHNNYLQSTYRYFKRTMVRNFKIRILLQKMFKDIKTVLCSACNDL